jgi:ribosomal protein L11 methyltransferase
MKNYQILKINTTEEATREMLIAELSLVGFDAFEETEQSLEAYIEAGKLLDTDFKSILEQYHVTDYELNVLADKNWNELWEKNFEPIVVADKCLIRADFHQVEEIYPYEIIINPKMAFGTGHHASTMLMMEQQFSVSHKDKKVIDAGCGTGILAILAEMLGAKNVIAFDISEWAVRNTEENLGINYCKKIQVKEGTIQDMLPFAEKIDIILANIERNTLLAEISTYAEQLADNGILLVSGFLDEHTIEIVECGEQAGLSFDYKNTKDGWAAVRFCKVV